MATIHHISTSTMCPIGGRLVMGGRTPILERAKLVCHCLVVETRAGVLLVDTGLYATTDIHAPRVGPIERALLGAEIRREELAISRVRALGYHPRDVRHVLPTHLDLDHAGGIADFPWASVHLMQREHDAAMARAGFIGGARYIRRHYEDARFVLHDVAGESWRGFEAVRPVPGTADEVLLLPLHGHTKGHAAVAVDTGSGFVVHCGDAYFSKVEMVPGTDAPPALELFQRAVAVDDALRRRNRDRLRELVADNADVRVFCAHDAKELEDFTVRPS